MSRWSRLGIGLLLAFWLTRLLGIGIFPPFVDEAFHINFGRNVAATGPLMHAEEGRQLVIWWFMAFQAGANASIWVARVASLLVVMLGAAAFLALGRLLAGAWGLILAGGVLLFSPYHMFFDRIALADPASNALALTGVYFSARLLRRCDLRDAALAGLTLFLAFGAKVSALPYLAVPLAAVLTLKPHSRTRQESLRWTTVALGLGGSLALVWTAVLTGRGHNPFFYLLSGTGGTENPLARILNRIPPNIETNMHNLLGFFGPALLVALFGGLLVLIWQRRWFLPLLVSLPWAVYWLNNRPDTRHLMTPVSLLLLAGVVVLADWLARRPRSVQVATLGVMVAVGLALWLPFVLLPAADLRLPPADFHQYISSEASGSGIAEVIADLQGRQPQRVYGLMANCLSLEFMTLGELPVACPNINPNGATLPELTALLRENRQPGYYAVVEAIDYVPQDTPGTLVLTVERPGDGPVLRIYDLSP